jgi:carbon monoxide dehydrogenase subunit G
MAIELDNSFTVPVPPEQAWDVLLDVERIAPCMPGASVTSVEGDEITGQVKVKLGPLSLTYKGTAKFTEKDPASHTIAIEATGKETRGAGTASATVHASLKPADAEGQTTVSIHTSLNVTGRPAQFGRSLLPEVSGKLIDQFAANLAALIGSTKRPAETETEAGAGAGGGAETEAEPEAAPAQDAAASDSASAATAAGTAAATQPTAAPAKPVAQLQQEDSLNLIKLVGGPVLKRVIPVVVAAALIAIFQRRIRGLFSRSKS